MFQGIDLFSDTVTIPPNDMRNAALDAPLGDEQQGEDPTTLKLEQRMADLLGKSAAMFFVSATLCNQIAVRLHCEPGDEAIGADNNHIFNAEGGGAAFHSGVQGRMIPTKNGIFGKTEITERFRQGKTPHQPKSRLVMIENTSNYGGGIAWSLEKLQEVVMTAKDLGLKTHFDGARIFNASLATGCSVKDLSEGYDTVTVCFSKALACPTGAVLLFDEKDYTKVRRLKQVFGGSMRQSGILSAMALYALDHQIDRIVEDHQNAEIFAKGLMELPEISTSYEPFSTNMVFFSLAAKGICPDFFFEYCLSQGLRFSRPQPNRFRAVTHLGITQATIAESLRIIKNALSQNPKTA